MRTKLKQLLDCGGRQMIVWDDYRSGGYIFSTIVWNLLQNAKIYGLGYRLNLAIAGKNDRDLLPRRNNEKSFLPSGIAGLMDLTLLREGSKSGYL